MIKQKIKNIVSLGAIASLSLSLIACGEINTHSKNKSPEHRQRFHEKHSYSSPSPEQHPVTFQNNTITQVDDSTIKLTGAEVTRDNKGNPMLVILFNYKNNGKKSKVLQKAYLESITANQKIGNNTKNLPVGTPANNFKYKKQADYLQKKVFPDVSIQSVYYYKIIDKNKPVTLVIHDPHKKKISTKEYPINGNI